MMQWPALSIEEEITSHEKTSLYIRNLHFYVFRIKDWDLVIILKIETLLMTSKRMVLGNNGGSGLARKCSLLKN